MGMSAPVKLEGPPPRVLQGPDKVAALLLAVGKDLAGRLLGRFEPEELKRISRSAADLGPISAPELERIVEEFTHEFSHGTSLYGTAKELERLLTGVLPGDQVAEIMSDVLGNTNRSIWERISGVSESILAAYLMKEHPQTAALILSKVKPACAAKVMGLLPQALRNDLMRRMLSFKPVVEETMRIVEKTLHEDFMLNFARNMGVDTHARMADIINKMERDQMEDVLESLAQARPKTAEVLKGLLFTFEDLIKLAPRARMTILDLVPNERIVVALKGTDPAFRDALLSAMGSRARRMVEAELETGEPVPQRDVAEARRFITDLALEMAGRGEIELNPDGEEAPVYR
ncbi:flagellar motor switch protein FliG [Salinarimonas soli]|uniref:Flagellar motor switch protein FliG n=1 Tax=Salinarimonas soli TaxID=1638099 RepID=A0A5B2V8Y9_9HYPH|nr:flagellar motor switch protein FliG [Salinarimonas soli]KAA2234697.1 flagellar motor switch protein FliG [Salinarimonas soli]